jgi:hypothetical protein
MTPFEFIEHYCSGNEDDGETALDRLLDAAWVDTGNKCDGHGREIRRGVERLPLVCEDQDGEVRLYNNGERWLLVDEAWPCGHWALRKADVEQMQVAKRW